MRSVLDPLGFSRLADVIARLRVLLLPLLCWLPLLVLAGLDGVVVSPRVRMPFLFDYSVHVRFWLAMPLLMLAESAVEPWLRRAVDELLSSDVIARDEHLPFERSLWGVLRWHRSVPVEALLLGLAILNVLLGLGVSPPCPSSWRTDSRAAALWYSIVSIPLFQFLCFRWIWWFWGWSRVLWHASRLNLQLMATHPDRLGGIGFLNVAHARFALIVFALSSVAASQVGVRTTFYGARASESELTIAAVVAFGALFLLTPLLVFSPRLLRTRQRALFDYGSFAFAYTRAFRDRWITGGPVRGVDTLGSQDIQALSDLQGSFGAVCRMRIVMWEPGLLLVVVFASALPMLPLVLTEVPIKQLLKAALRMLG